MNTTDVVANPFVDDFQDAELKEKLYDIIKSRVWIRTDKKIKLASGATSSEYFNMKKLGADGLALAAAAMYRHVKKTKTVSVGGLESGAIPLAVTISNISLAQNDTPPLEWFYVRKSTKSHGINNQIEGSPRPPVMILDDVITSGGSSIKAIRAIKDEGIEYIGTMCVLFRGDSQQRQRLEQEGSFDCIFSKDDFKRT